MKKLIASVLCACMISSLLVGCGDKTTTPPATDEGTEEPAAEEPAQEPAATGDNVINLWAFTDEVPTMVEKFLEQNPDFGYEVNSTIIETTDGAYQPALDQALASGGKDAPDIYCAEAAFVLKYTQGDASQYAAAYEDLGIDVASEIETADIAQYTVDIGTNPDGKVVALGYQATGAHLSIVVPSQRMYGERMILPKSKQKSAAAAEAGISSLQQQKS